jgi:predicted RNA-binding protein YlxR (DUF448 family)
MPRKDKFLRKCISCSVFKPKDDLIKITKEAKSGDIIVLPSSNIYGRSVYLCPDKSCIDEAFKKRKIEKFIKANVSQVIKEKISTVLEK